MALDDLAEVFERTRYELMRDQHWSDLRSAERETRVGLAHRALEESGVLTEIDQLRRQADRVTELVSLLDQREAELADRRAQHEIALAEREGRIASLEARVEELGDRVELAESRADEADARVRAVRALLDGEPVPAALVAQASAAGAARVTAQVAEEPDGRSEAAERGAGHGRLPRFRARAGSH
jgi:chromosome segregation ATPase